MSDSAPSNQHNLLYILTTLQAIEQIVAYSDGFNTFDDFLWANKRLNFNGSLQLLMVIGEEIKKLDTSLKSLFPQIPWRSIQGIRNRIAHDYRGIDHEEVFAIIKQELSPLKTVLVNMMDRVHYDPTVLQQALASIYYSEIGYLRSKLR